MNRQEIFDKVRTHLLTQNAKAMADYGDSCMYRAPDGRRCAIGCLIPDEMYNPDFEGEGIDGLPWALREYLGGVDNDDILQELQNVHDCFNPDDWAGQLDYIATEYGLNRA